MNAKQPSRNEETLVGMWRLVSFDVEAQATGKRKPAFGNAPKGRLVLLANGFMMLFITAEGRRSAKTDEEKIDGFNTMIAYSGKYSVEGENFITDVDLAWQEAWTGAKQTRTYRFIGPRAQFTSSWAPSLFDADKIVRGILEFEREPAAG
jgi:hypothetical protein